MGRDAAKACENQCFRCRKEAAKYNDKLGSREGAAELLGISVSSLADYELGNTKVIPVDKVVLMADIYNAPELMAWYCSSECLIGKSLEMPSPEIASVERSTNGGSSWSQIYQGTATSTTNNVAFGTTSVMYRVKAYDTEGLESGWRTSSQVTVVNNNAPSAPPSIAVPNDVKGGSTLVISWTAASDSDGNLSGYILERSTDGGSAYTQVYKGNALTYTDTITKGWATVMYRVKAYDSYNAQSGYTTSTKRTVDNNTAPTITTSSAASLGTKSSGFTVSYSVDDVDASDTLTVTEKLDGTTKRTYTATRKTTNSFAVTGEYFQKITNGSHTMTVTVTDGKATVTKTFTFTKAVTAASITLAKPMEADAQITLCAITVGGLIPADAVFKVEVTNNGKDSSPVWEDATTEARNGRNHLFTNQTAANGFAFNFRVTAERGASGESGYIASIQGGFQ